MEITHSHWADSYLCMKKIKNNFMRKKESSKKSSVKFDVKKIYACEIIPNGYFANERGVAILRLNWIKVSKGKYEDVFEWHKLEDSRDGWHNGWKTFKEAWQFHGFGMLKKRTFNNSKDFLKWAWSVVGKNKLHKKSVFTTHSLLRKHLKH